MTTGRIRPLSVAGAALIDAAGSLDARGAFYQCVTGDLLTQAAGHTVRVRQVNCSRSVYGASRGISVTTASAAGDKVVMGLSGAVLDVVVDLRTGSPGFGSWHMERLDEERRAAVYVPPGAGHAFLALTDDTTVLYLLSQVHDPAREQRINPLDREIGIAWPDEIAPVLSDRDAQAPGLAQAVEAGLLPSFTDDLPVAAG
jgi:dTDP-4-dehydrorhamnose 3,5-epimerase